MVKTNKFFGGILLIAGTSVGAGMLAMPVMSSFCGFIPAFILLAFFWAFMLLTAYLFLEVNLSMKGDVNMISMAEKTLGQTGKIICWITYLLLLYSLTAAYISGSAPVFNEIFKSITTHNVPAWVGPLPLIVIFGLFVYLGTKSVDYINRLLMLGLVVSYILLVVFVPQHIRIEFLRHFDAKMMILAVPIMITSFGYHIIIPSLTTYMRHNVKKLRLMIFIGSLIPVIVYVLWELIILGTIPIEGEMGLFNTWLQSKPVTFSLMNAVKNPWIATGAETFTFFAIITSFLGVSLSLSDFLRDGFRIKHTHVGRFLVCLLTFGPPLIFVYTYQRGFYLALEFAAAFVAILLALYPALMTWVLPKKGFFKTFWGRSILVFVIIVSLLIISIDVMEKFGYLSPLMSKYFK
jgi:tyrosine-specific transport protein